MGPPSIDDHLADAGMDWVPAEIGDDRSRFADARALKAYARAAPVTRASAKSLTVMHRKVKNQRLASVGYLWSFAALTASPGGRAQSTKAPDLEANSAAKSSAGVRSLFRIERDGGDIQAVDTQKRSVPSSSFSNTPPFR